MGLVLWPWPDDEPDDGLPDPGDVDYPQTRVHGLAFGLSKRSSAAFS
jgi:hypothetical protein